MFLLEKYSSSTLNTIFENYLGNILNTFKHTFYSTALLKTTRKDSRTVNQKFLFTINYQSSILSKFASKSFYKSFYNLRKLFVHLAILIICF